jgi:hypothetical protein
MNAFGDSIENKLLDTENPAANETNKGGVAKGSLEDAIFIVSDILQRFKGESKVRIDVLHELERIIREIRFLFKEDVALDQDHIDAILVDFVNYIGVKMGVDYAMYTYCLDEIRQDL